MSAVADGFLDAVLTILAFRDGQKTCHFAFLQEIVAVNHPHEILCPASGPEISLEQTVQIHGIFSVIWEGPAFQFHFMPKEGS